ncbi:NAD-dependent epimerase/dehydratase family protein [Patescibacteria group bacterium]|nr:NAD-dependent epimerase/dehydratase family protein [Patescibacteria group bacterium]
MKALVTGGAGFIGSAVVRHGLAKGWQITILDNFSTGYQENVPTSKNLTVIEGDVCDSKLVASAVKGVDAVFHLAASVGNVRSIEDPIHDSHINILGTLNLLENMRKAGVERIVYSSSAAIFGETRYLPVDESHPCDPVSPYGVSKLAAEKQVLCYGRLYDWHTACLRYFNVYGINQRYDAYGNVIPIFVRRILEGQPLIVYGTGEQTRDFVNVEDIATANWQALESADGGVFNIGLGEATTINGLLSTLSDILKQKLEVHYTESRLGEVLHSCAAIDRAIEVFGYQPHVSLPQGLRRYLDWVRE